MEIGHHLLSLQSNYHSTWHPFYSPLLALALHNHSKWSVACLFLLNSKANTLYIWFHHYARKDAGWRMFDHKKNTVVAGCFIVVVSCFCWPFSFFVIFFITCNFCKLFFYCSRFTVCYFFTTWNFYKLFFIVDKGQGYYFIIFIHCLRGVSAPIHMICALRSQCAGLGAVWPLKTHRSAGLFLLTFFIFYYFF